MKKEDPFLTTIPNQKKVLRLHYLKTLRLLNEKRREEAEEETIKQLIPLLSSCSSVLSFSSRKEELSLRYVNEYLLEKNALFLPRIEKEALLIQPVYSLSELMPGSFGILEPQLPSFSHHEIECILVPALCFDKAGFRLGRGKGYFDRLIASLHQREIFPKLIGVGFKEQLHPELLPRESFDKRVDALLLL